MIRSLRTRHRRMILVIALLTALVAIAAWRARQSVPTVERLPSSTMDVER